MIWCELGRLYNIKYSSSFTSSKYIGWAMGKEELWHRGGDRPAIIFLHESYEWWYKGQPHREEGPAYINTKQDVKQWYWRGDLHRKDGPASIEGGLKSWWLYGRNFTEEDWKNAVDGR